MADAMTQVREAVHMLQMALPRLEVGSEQQKTVLKMIQDGSKIAPADAEGQGVQQTTLIGLLEKAKQNQQLMGLQAQMQPPGGAPAPGAAPPPGM